MADDAMKQAFTGACNEVRGLIKTAATANKFLADIVKANEHAAGPKEDKGEMIANLMLAYRHLEDASMRLGKAIQAHDGGVSVYDKDTTVGA